VAVCAKGPARVDFAEPATPQTNLFRVAKTNIIFNPTLLNKRGANSNPPTTRLNLQFARIRLSRGNPSATSIIADVNQVYLRKRHELTLGANRHGMVAGRG